MNTRLNSLTMLVLVFTLTWSAPPSASAQPDNEPKSPPNAGQGRQLILTKLDRIRFDSVSYDGLPLAEVVRNLREESRKRDPEKKGLNFIVNPNAPPGLVTVGPSGAPTEQIDVGSIAVKINPPLMDVRLADVLDAVVKVAERPIQYSIEDYGVVFSLRSAEPTYREEVGFMFPGGTPGELLSAVQQHYKVDWVSVVDIPKEMEAVHIPRLRITVASLAPILPPAGGTNSLAALVSLYNQLGEQKPELGRLIVKGDLANPSVVMFVPDKAMTDLQPKLKVKAFSIYGINGEKLQTDIGLAREEALRYADQVRGGSGLRYLEGTVAMHKETGLLVATGTDSFVEMVESIVAASQPKDRDRDRK